MISCVGPPAGKAGEARDSPGKEFQKILALGPETWLFQHSSVFLALGPGVSGPKASTVSTPGPGTGRSAGSRPTAYTALRAGQGPDERGCRHRAVTSNVSSKPKLEVTSVTQRRQDRNLKHCTAPCPPRGCGAVSSARPQPPPPKPLGARSSTPGACRWPVHRVCADGKAPCTLMPVSLNRSWINEWIHAIVGPPRPRGRRFLEESFLGGFPTVPLPTSQASQDLLPRLSPGP